MPPKLIKNPKNGASRISQACDRCRIKKIKCDGSLPSCSNCARISFNCKTSDKLTRRSFPKGYTENLEQNLIFLQNENLKLISLMKASSSTAQSYKQLELLSGRNDVDVLLDSLPEVSNAKSKSGSADSDTALSDSSYEEMLKGSSPSPPAGACCGSSCCSSQERSSSALHFINVLVNQVLVGKNLVNHSFTSHLDKVISPAVSNDQSSGDNTSNTLSDDQFVGSNSLAFILDSILFKLFLLANGQNNALIMNYKNLIILNKFIENYFNHINKNFLCIVNEFDFFTNFAKFKSQLKHLVLQYNAMLNSQGKDPRSEANENITMNETSLNFKIQLLLIIYVGNINYSILYPESSASSKQNTFKFFKLNYDYVFLKKVILSKLNVIQEPSLETLQNLLLFFYLSLSYDNHNTLSDKSLEEKQQQQQQQPSFSDQYLVNATNNSSFLTKISSIVNNYLVNILAINVNSSNIASFQLSKTSNGSRSFPHDIIKGEHDEGKVGSVGMSTLGNSSQISDSFYNVYNSENLKLRLYWCVYVLNSFLVLQTGDYTNNDFMHKHYGDISKSNKIPDLDNLLTTNANLKPMCELIDFFKIINEFILSSDHSHFHLDDGTKVPNKNKDSSSPNWENELWLLEPEKLVQLDKKLTAWKQGLVSSNLFHEIPIGEAPNWKNLFVLKAFGNGSSHPTMESRSATESNAPRPRSSSFAPKDAHQLEGNSGEDLVFSLPAIQFSLVYLYVRSLIHLKLMKFGTILTSKKNLNKVEDVDNAVINYGTIAREFLSYYILIDFINNDFHNANNLFSDGASSFDESNGSVEPRLKKRKYSTNSPNSTMSGGNEYDGINGAKSKNKLINVKSIEQEFISSIISKSSSGSGASHSGCSSPDSSLNNSSLNKEIDSFFSSSSSSKFNLNVFSKSVHSIIESFSKRRISKSTASSSSSSFKNGFKLVPINLLKMAMIQISTLLAIVKNYYKPNGALYNDSIKIIIKVLVALLKNYELDSTNSGDGVSNNWYKGWFKAIEKEMLTLHLEHSRPSSLVPSGENHRSFSPAIPMAHSQSYNLTTTSVSNLNNSLSGSVGSRFRSDSLASKTTDSMSLSIDMSPTSSVNSLFSNRDSIRTVGSAASSSSFAPQQKHLPPRRRLNSMSVLENDHFYGSHNNGTDLKHSLFMKRNSSGAAHRNSGNFSHHNNHPAGAAHNDLTGINMKTVDSEFTNISSACAPTEIDTDSISSMITTDFNAGAEAIFGTAKTDSTTNNKDDFNLNSLFDWNKVGSHGTNFQNAMVNDSFAGDSIGVDRRSSQDAANNIQKVNDAANCIVEQEDSDAENLRMKDFSINNLVENIICPSYAMDFGKPAQEKAIAGKDESLTRIKEEQDAQESKVKKALILDLSSGNQSQNQNQGDDICSERSSAVDPAHVSGNFDDISDFCSPATLQNYKLNSEIGGEDMERAHSQDKLSVSGTHREFRHSDVSSLSDIRQKFNDFNLFLK